MNDLWQQLTPAMLTDLLRRHGHLVQGQVTTLNITSIFETPPSILMKLTVEYSHDAPADLPTHLFLKMPKAHKLARGKREADFYANIAPLMPTVPLVPSLGTSYNAATGMSYLLLLDVSATHSTREGGVLSWEELESMVNGLAHLHATWWNHPNLVKLVGESPEDAFAADFARNDILYAQLVDRLGDRLTRKERRIFDSFLADGPPLLLERACSGQALTLCHPENHRGNFLFPHQSGGSLYIIDWHQYRCWWGPKDIVGLVNRCMAPEQYHQVESLLRAYYEQLLYHGVTNYSWEECRQDYRLGLVDYLTILLQFQYYPESFFTRQFTATMHEFQAWGCEEFVN